MQNRHSVAPVLESIGSPQEHELLLGLSSDGFDLLLLPRLGLRDGLLLAFSAHTSEAHLR